MFTEVSIMFDIYTYCIFTLYSNFIGENFEDWIQGIWGMKALDTVLIDLAEVFASIRLQAWALKGLLSF